MNRLKEQYKNEIAPALFKELGLDNVMQTPRIEKVVVNIGVGEALDNPKALEAAVNDLTIITGQKPVVTAAKDRKSTRLNSSHSDRSRMPSSA